MIRSILLRFDTADGRSIGKGNWSGRSAANRPPPSASTIFAALDVQLTGPDSAKIALAPSAAKRRAMPFANVVTLSCHQCCSSRQHVRH